MEYLFTSESIISFFILVVLEVVLGIDNVIFVSIIMNRLKEKKKRPEKSPPLMDDNRNYFKKLIINGVRMVIGAGRESGVYCIW